MNHTKKTAIILLTMLFYPICSQATNYTFVFDGPATTYNVTSSNHSFDVDLSSYTGLIAHQGAIYLEKSVNNGGSWEIQTFFNGPYAPIPYSPNPFPFGQILAEGTTEYRVRGQMGIPGPNGTRTSATYTFRYTKQPAAPSSVSRTPTTSTNGSVTVSWPASTNATKYTLQQQFNGGSWVTKQDTSTRSKTFPFASLAKGTYRYRVRACRVGAFTACSGYRYASNNYVPPVAPSSITISPINSAAGSQTVSWGSSSQATKYTLQRQINDGSWATVQDSSATSDSFSGLASGKYEYRVRACAYTACSTYKPSAASYVARTPGAITTTGATTNDIDGTYTLNWAASSGSVESYQLQRRTAAYGSSSYSGWSTIQNTSSRTRAESSLGSGNYQYRVRSKKGTAYSSWTAVKTVSVLRVPGAPSSLVVPNWSSNGSLAISWGAASGVVVNYQLYRRTAAYNAGNVGTWTGFTLYKTQTALSWTESNLSDSFYDYQVKACNANGCGGARDQSMSTVLKMPSVPTAVTLMPNPSDGRFVLSWNEVPEFVEYYEIEQQRSTTLGVSWEAWAEDSKSPWPINAYGSGTEAVSLEKPTHSTGENTHYRYQVKSCNGSGCSNFSTAVEVVVEPPGTPETLLIETMDAGAGVVPLGAGAYVDYDFDGNYNLYWTSVAGNDPAIEYRIEKFVDGVAFNGAGYEFSTSDINNLNYAETGLLDGKTYSYVVEACLMLTGSATYHCGDPSYSYDVIVALPPAQVTGLSLSPGTGSDIDLIWNAPSTGTVTGYLIEYRHKISAAGTWTAWDRLADAVDDGLNQPDITTTHYSTSNLFGGGGGIYEFRVSGCNQSTLNCGGSSNFVVEAPSSPQDLSLGYAGSNYNLTWTAPATGTTTLYLIERRFDQIGGWIVDGTVSAAGTTYSSATLVGSQVGIYESRVTACNLSTLICSAPSDIVSKLVYDIDSAPAPASALAPVLPSSSDQVGSINGSFRVNESGAATYSIPLMSAAGTAGVAPSLSLNYSSQGGNGLLGLGWSLGGLSEISRCRQTYQQDLNAQPITWTKEDRFCMDGQRLVMTSDPNTHSYGDDGTTYRTEIDSFAEVTLATTGLGASEVPDYFDVTRKDGSTSRYGWLGTSVSEFKVNNMDGTASSDILSWSVRRVIDNVGNPIHFIYNNDPATGHRLMEVRYAYASTADNEGALADAGAITSFAYIERDDDLEVNLSGRSFARTQRLSIITVKNDSDVLRTYELNYKATTGTTVVSGANTQLSRVESIEECAGNATCLPLTTFDWAEPRAFAKGAAGSNQADLSPTSGYVLYEKLFADINGDGYQDLISTETNGSSYRVHQSIYDETTSLFVYKGLVGAYPDEVRINLVDYNADGRMDLAVWRDADNSVRLYLSTPQPAEQWQLVSHATISNVTKKPIFVDVDADGLADMISGTNVYLLKKKPNEPVTSAAYYSYQLSSSFQIVTGAYPNEFCGVQTVISQGEPVVPIGDINGDGVIDFYGEFKFSTCSPVLTVYGIGVTKRDASTGQYRLEKLSSLTGTLYDTGASSDGRDIRFADVNGDGLTDVLRLVHDSADTTPWNWQLFFSTGDELNPFMGSDGKRWLLGGGTEDSAEKKAPGFIDINGDGYQDIYWHEHGSATRELRVRYWNTQTQDYGNPETLLSQTNSDYTYQLLHWDPDAEADYIRINNSDRMNAYRSFSLSAPTNLITQITNGLGAVTDVNYENLSDTLHYTRIEGIGSTVQEITAQYMGHSFTYETTITDASVFYETINNPFNYLPAGSTTLEPEGVNPVMELFGPMAVVTRVDSSSPSAVDPDTGNYSLNSSAKAAIEYHYEQAKIQAGGRGMLGFKTLRTKDMQTDVETTTVYRQDWPFIGYPLLTEVKTKEGGLLSSASNTWGLVGVPSGTSMAGGSAALANVQPYLDRSVEHTYDFRYAEDDNLANDIILATSMTDSVYDSYGNPTSITQTQYQGEPNPGETNWLLETQTSNTYYDDGYANAERYGRLFETNVVTTKQNSSAVQTDQQSRRSTFDYNNTSGLLVQEKIHYLGTGCASGTATDCDLKTVYEHDIYGNVTTATQTGWDGNASTPRTSTTVYTSNGRYVDHSINHYGQIVSGVANIGNVEQRNEYGVPTEVQDITGTFIKTEYSPMGRQYWQYAETGSSSYNYLSTSIGNCPTGTAYRAITEGDDLAESQECFDILGRKTRSMSKDFAGSWVYQDVVYDLLGRVARQSEPHYGVASLWTTFTYDLLGRVTNTVLPDGSGGTVDYEGFVTTATTSDDLSTAADETREHIETVNALGHVVEVRDSLGIAGATNAEKPQVTYEYDALGNLIQMNSITQTGDTVAGTYSTVLNYDSLGRKLSMDDPDKGVWTYEYNAFGELTSQTSANQSVGVTTAMDYDSLGRMVARLDFAANGNSEGSTAWAYNNGSSGNSIGQLTSVTYTGDHYRAGNALINTSIPDYAQSYDYDTYGRQIKVTTVMGDSGNLGTYYQSATFDKYGRPHQTFDIDTGSSSTGNELYGVQYDYNVYGYQTTIDDVRKDNGATLQTYHEVKAMNQRGQITHERRGITQTFYQYDDETGRLCYKHTRAGINGTNSNVDCDTAAPGSGLTGTTDIQDLVYKWDTLGNLRQRWEYSGSKALTESFSYDKLNRLTSAATSGGPTTTVTYDSLGNIKTKTGVGTYAYGANGAGPHAVTSAGGATYAYDANGNNTSGDGRTIKYSSFDKAYEISKGDHTTSFAYGPSRSRFLRTDVNTVENTSTQTLYVGASEYVTDLNTGTLEIKRMVAGTLHTLHFEAATGIASNESQALIFTDHLGSTDVITDMSGAILQEQSFNPWGERRTASNWQTVLSTFDPEFTFAVTGLVHSGTNDGFTGHEMLDDVGIIHMNGRIYDAKLGRFLQADPLIQAPFNTQSLNRYSYGWNNPLNGTDPSGYGWKKYAGMIVGAILVVATGGTASALVTTWWGGGILGGVVGGVGAAANGGNILQGIAFGAFSGAAGGFIGGGGSIFGGELAGISLGLGVVGGITSVLQGGKFGHGFTAAGAGAYLGGKIGGFAKGASQTLKNAGKFVAKTVLGGTISKLTGGKFGNGAGYTAFSSAVAWANTARGKTLTGEEVGNSSKSSSDFKENVRAELDKLRENPVIASIETEYGQVTLTFDNSSSTGITGNTININQDTFNLAYPVDGQATVNAFYDTLSTDLADEVFFSRLESFEASVPDMNNFSIQRTLVHEIFHLNDGASPVDYFINKPIIEASVIGRTNAFMFKNYNEPYRVSDHSRIQRID